MNVAASGGMVVDLSPKLFNDVKEHSALDRHLEIKAPQGFTLIELIIVVVLLGVVIGLVAPRMMSTSRREAEITASALASLLSTAAHRDAIGSDAIALHFDGEQQVFELLVRSDDPERDHSEVAGWRADPLVEPVHLDVLQVRNTLIDGAEADDSTWTILFPRTEPRPQIAIIIERKDVGESRQGWVIELLPHSTSATLSTIDASGALKGRALLPVDLDAQGLGEEPW